MENIKRGCLQIAYDNGMVNRYFSEEVVLDGMLRIVLANFSKEEIDKVEHELSLLSESDFKEAVDGYKDFRYSYIPLISPLADRLLDFAFGEYYE